MVHWLRYPAISFPDVLSVSPTQGLSLGGDHVRSLEGVWVNPTCIEMHHTGCYHCPPKSFLMSTWLCFDYFNPLCPVWYWFVIQMRWWQQNKNNKTVPETQVIHIETSPLCFAGILPWEYQQRKLCSDSLSYNNVFMTLQPPLPSTLSTWTLRAWTERYVANDITCMLLPINIFSI